jgi:hypothetical protein
MLLALLSIGVSSCYYQYIPVPSHTPLFTKSGEFEAAVMGGAGGFVAANASASLTDHLAVCAAGSWMPGNAKNLSNHAGFAFEGQLCRYTRSEFGDPSSISFGGGYGSSHYIEDGRDPIDPQASLTSLGHSTLQYWHLFAELQTAWKVQTSYLGFSVRASFVDGFNYHSDNRYSVSRDTSGSAAVIDNTPKRVLGITAIAFQKTPVGKFGPMMLYVLLQAGITIIRTESVGPSPVLGLGLATSF